MWGNVGSMQAQAVHVQTLLKQKMIKRQGLTALAAGVNYIDIKKIYTTAYRIYRNTGLQMV